MNKKILLCTTSVYRYAQPSLATKITSPANPFILVADPANAWIAIYNLCLSPHGCVHRRSCTLPSAARSSSHSTLARVRDQSHCRRRS